jgi:hypothetical protein
LKFISSSNLPELRRIPSFSMAIFSIYDQAYICLIHFYGRTLSNSGWEGSSPVSDRAGKLSLLLREFLRVPLRRI